MFIILVAGFGISFRLNASLRAVFSFSEEGLLLTIVGRAITFIVIVSDFVTNPW